MTKFPLVGLITMVSAIAVLSSCVPRLKVSSLLPDVVQVASTTDNPSTPTAVIEDKHHIQTDDFFVSEIPLTDQQFVYVNVAKMITAPSAESQNKAQFRLTRNGNLIWTQHYYKTHIASKEDLKLNKEVIYFHVWDDNYKYRAPLNREEAQGADWCLSKIEDLSELQNGIVITDGGTAVKQDNIRVLN